MNRSTFLGLIVYALFLTALITLRGELLLLVFPFALYLLIGLWRGPEEIKLEAARHLSAERAAPDSNVDVTLTVTNRGEALEEVLIEDILPPHLTIRSGSPISLLTLPRGASHTLEYTVSGPRGGYAFEGVKVKVNDHLAVTSREVRIEAQSQLFVFPPLTRLHRVTIRPRRTRVYIGDVPARAGGSGTEFFGVRDYQPGDSPHSINWRVSARHAGQLYSNEYQQERVVDVGVVLDGRLSTNLFGHHRSIFEYSVQAAAALADVFLMQGNRVGLLLYGKYLGWTFSGYGKIQRERILQALAHAQSGDSQIFTALEYIPTRLFPPESQLIVVSPLTAEDVLSLIRLRAVGYQVMVVSPDPVSFELSFLPAAPEVEMSARVNRMERELIFQKLQRAGVQTLDWNVAQPFDLAVQQKLSRPPAWLRAIGG